jgi:UDP-sugar transporter A1/2/3
MSAWVLNKKISMYQYGILLLLTLGVIMVQVAENQINQSHISEDIDKGIIENDDIKENNHKIVIGLISVIIASLTSAYSGCYFEKILKNVTSNVWIRNIQLGIFALILSTIGMMINDYTEIMEDGMFRGYNSMTWIVIINQSIGGLLVALVIKYADNILKVISNSVSMILSGLLSIWIFNFQPNLLYLTGAIIVILSIFLYNSQNNK